MNLSAFKLKPSATTDENRIRYLEASRFASWFDTTASRLVDHFSHPVHEEITHRMYGCTAPLEDASCANSVPGKYTPSAVLFGVQWNDNPPFQVTKSASCPLSTTIRLPNFSECWIKLFKDAEKNPSGDYYDGTTGHALIYRVHFGDMQFLHAMGSWDGELARDTKLKIMSWSELMYRVSIGDIDPGIQLTDTNIDEIRATFLTNGWSIKGLLTLGQDSKITEQVSDVAFGSLLHMIQDSFSRPHVERDPATSGSCPNYPGLRKADDIREFHSYENQHKDKHGEHDSRNYMESHVRGVEPNVVEIGKTLIAMRAEKKPWAEIRDYVDKCIFPVPDAYLRRPSGPGAAYRL